MKIIDAIGNEILPDHTLYWKAKDLYVKVAQVIQPDSDNHIPGGLMIVIALPIKGDSDTQISEFIRTIDPTSEQLVHKMAGGK
jgi:hypothetical protein